MITLLLNNYAIITNYLHKIVFFQKVEKNYLDKHYLNFNVACDIFDVAIF